MFHLIDSDRHHVLPYKQTTSSPSLPSPFTHTYTYTHLLPLTFTPSFLPQRVLILLLCGAVPEQWEVHTEGLCSKTPLGGRSKMIECPLAQGGSEIYHVSGWGLCVCVWRGGGELAHCVTLCVDNVMAYGSLLLSVMSRAVI